MHLALVGLFLQAGYFAFTYLSLKFGLSAGAVALITSQQPILVGLLAPLLARERVSLRHWAGLLLGVAGAALVILAKSSLGTASAAGLLFAVLALLSIVAGKLWGKRYGTDPDRKRGGG